MICFSDLILSESGPHYLQALTKRWRISSNKDPGSGTPVGISTVGALLEYLIQTTPFNERRSLTGRIRIA